MMEKKVFNQSEEQLGTKKYQAGHTGFCLYCSIPIETGKFCSPECDEDFDLAKKIGLSRFR
jgi:hypothetical protein